MIRMDGKYRTMEGHDVRIYALDGEKRWPVHGAFKSLGTTEGWIPTAWSDLGKCCADSPDCDLIEIKPAAIDRMIEWLNARPIRQYGPLVYQQALTPNAEADAYQAALTEARRIKAEAEKEG